MDIKADINFERRAKLGENGWNSEVFRGYDPQLATVLAFKRIEKSKFLAPGTFFEESQKIQKARHSRVAEIKYACQTDDCIWLAMPLYEAGSLQGLISKRALTVREVLHYGIGFLTGLQHVHAQKMVHLDIKPANILIDDAGDAILTDFGCSRIMDEHFLVDPVAAYPLHQVPERFSSNKLGIEADIYQAGLTLYRLANGDALFFEPVGGNKSSDDIKDNKTRNKINEKIKKGKFPERNTFLPHIPFRLRRAIVKALDVDPDKRFRSAAEFINALSDIQDGLDWQYKEDAQHRVWTLDGGTSLISIELQLGEEGRPCSITTTKTNKETSNIQRSTKHCGQRPTLPEALKWVAEIAKELDDS